MWVTKLNLASEIIDFKEIADFCISNFDDNFNHKMKYFRKVISTSKLSWINTCSLSNNKFAEPQKYNIHFALLSSHFDWLKGLRSQMGMTVQHIFTTEDHFQDFHSTDRQYKLTTSNTRLRQAPDVPYKRRTPSA